MGTKPEVVPKSAGIAPNATAFGPPANPARNEPIGLTMRRNERGGLVSHPALQAGGRRFDPGTLHH